MNRYEKEKAVVALRNQGKNYREISKLVQISIRDIKPILDKYGTEDQRLDSDLPNYLHDSDSDDSPKVVAISSRAYQLFSKGQRPLEVSIALNIEGPKALDLYNQYLDMSNMGALSRMYKEAGDDLSEIVKFYREAKRGGIIKDQILNYLETFSFDLPAVQEQYKSLKQQLGARRFEIGQGKAQLQEIERQTDTSRELLRTKIAAINQAQDEKWELDREKTELKRFVAKFRDNDQGYKEITHIVETRVKMILNDKSRLLDLAVLSVVNSLCNNKDKCKHLFEILDLENQGWQNSGVTGWDSSGSTMKRTPLMQYKSNPYLVSKGLIGTQFIGDRNDPTAQHYKDDIVRMSEWFYERLTQDLTVDIMKLLESRNKSNYI